MEIEWHCIPFYIVVSVYTANSVDINGYFQRKFRLVAIFWISFDSLDKQSSITFSNGWILFHSLEGQRINNTCTERRTTVKTERQTDLRIDCLWKITNEIGKFHGNFDRIFGTAIFGWVFFCPTHSFVSIPSIELWICFVHLHRANAIFYCDFSLFIFRPCQTGSRRTQRWRCMRKRRR